jgi:uncharacterized membrane protein
MISLQLPASRAKRYALLLLVLFWVAAGVNHLVRPEFYLKIMPAYLPAHEALVFWSGVFEVLGGIGVLIPRTRVMAGWGLILLLLAVYPANINMALHPEQFPQFSRLALYGRLPFQVLFIWWAWWATRSNDSR